MYALKTTISLCALFLATSISYSQSRDATQAVAEPSPSSPGIDYQAIGFPKADRLWAPADYQTALRAMKGLSIDQYPSNSNPASSPVIHSLTNLDNLAPFLDRTVPLDQRLLPCVDLIDAANAITAMYAGAQRRNPRIADDYLQMQGFVLHGVVAELSLLDEFVPTLDPQDPSYAIRMEGLEKMRAGMTQILTGALLVMGDRNRFSSNARAQFAVSLSSTFPTIAAQLPARTKTRFEDTIRRIAGEESNAAVRSALTKLGAGR